MDTTADGLDELSELRRRCAALQAENSELQMRLVQIYLSMNEAKLAVTCTDSFINE